MITFSESQQKIVDALEAINNAHWIDNYNGTISCSHCHTWFHKDDRYSYMRYCPYCNIKLAESEDKGMNQKDFKSKHDILITEFDGREDVNSDFFQGELTKFVDEFRNPIPIEILVNFKISRFTNIKNKGKVIELMDQFLVDLCKEINFK